MSVAISQFFILSPRGDTIISKDFRGDSPPQASESLFRRVKFWDKGDAPPVFAIDGVNYLHIRKNGLIFACTTRFNVSPSMVIELLNRITKVFKDYCGVLSEEAIRKVRSLPSRRPNREGDHRSDPPRAFLERPPLRTHTRNPL